MCGIAGFSGAFQPTLLDAMSQRIAHRGPDDDGIWFDEQYQVGLAHRRLAIVDLSPAGHQPMFDSERRTAVVFNGEIYNYLELRHKLETQGARFRSTTDTEVLLHLYRRRGLDMLSVLNGMFAFALWDLDKREILLARDGMGVKPLYTAHSPKGVLFASELKALLAEPSVARDLDPEGVACYPNYLWCPSPLTMLRSVRKLEAGHFLRIAHGKIVQEGIFYEPPFGAPTRRESAKVISDEVESVVTRAVQRQLVGDVEIGAFLSGGLDSSALVALAFQHVSHPMRTFTIARPGSVSGGVGVPDDLPYARTMAAHLGVGLQEVESALDPASELTEMVYHLDEPQPDFASLNVLAISRAARASGIKVLLSGAGADDLFAGYRRHCIHLLESWLVWVPPAVVQVIRRLAQQLPARSVALRRIQRGLQYAHLRGDPRRVGHLRWLGESDHRALFSENFRSQLEGHHVAERLHAALDRLPANTHPLERMLLLDTRFFLTDHNLNYTDKLSMAAGVEVRVPFLDPDVVRLACEISPALKVRGTIRKWVLKKAMGKHLPAEIIHRPKTGFGAPLRKWLHGPLRDVVEDTLSVRALRNRGIFSVSGVRSLLQRDARGHVDAAYPLLAVVCIELWCRRFCDASGDVSLASTPSKGSVATSVGAPRLGG